MVLFIGNFELYIYTINIMKSKKNLINFTRFYLTYLFNHFKLVESCYKSNYKMIDYFSICVSNIINMVVYKLTNKRSLLLQPTGTDNLLVPFLNKHINEFICLNELFESCFNVNRTLFNSYFKLY